LRAGPRGLVDTIVFNAAVAMWIVGRYGWIKEGVEPARKLLLGGAVKAKIASTRESFSVHDPPVFWNGTVSAGLSGDL